MDEASWAEWTSASFARPWTVGIEEELVLLDPERWRVAAAELARLRRSLDDAIREKLMLRAAAAGTHPLAVRAAVAISSSSR